MTVRGVTMALELIESGDFMKIDMRVGKIISAEIAGGVTKAAYKLIVDFGAGVGEKKSIAQLTHYPADKLVGRQILGVINLHPRQIGPHRSEVLILGVATHDKGTALIIPDQEAIIGAKVF